ncbi:MAG: hypothetical protein ACK46Q_04980 [Hyphomonas sp.]
MPTTQGANPAPTFDITPRAGQTDAEIDGWFRITFPKGKTEMAERAYWGKCLEDRPTNDKSDPAYYEWYRRLTDLQRNIADTAKKQKSADPKVKAERKAARAKNAKYQKYLAEKKDNYRAEVEAAGRQVREYGVIKTKEEKKEEQRQRTDQLNVRIRQDLAERRNPFSVDDYKNPRNFDYYTQDNMLKKAARYHICDKLLSDGSFSDGDKSSLDQLRNTIRSLGAILEINHPNDEAAQHLIKGALNSLRAAGAIRKSSGKVVLHGEVLRLRAEADREADLSEVQNIPGFGAYG